MALSWNTFPYAPNPAYPQFPQKRCETPRHHGLLYIPAATMCQMLWERDNENIALSKVLEVWFTCSPCGEMMVKLWKESNG